MEKTIPMPPNGAYLNEFASAIRAEEELSQAEMARKLGLSARQTYYNIETGRKAMGLNFLSKICKTFGYSISITIKKDENEGS